MRLFCALLILAGFTMNIRFSAQIVVLTLYTRYARCAAACMLKYLSVVLGRYTLYGEFRV